MVVVKVSGDPKLHPTSLSMFSISNGDNSNGSVDGGGDDISGAINGDGGDTGGGLTPPSSLRNRIPPLS